MTSAVDQSVFPDLTHPHVAGLAMGTLAILPRVAFTSATPTAAMTPMGLIERVTIHHSGFPQAWTLDDQGPTAEHLEFIRRFHTDAPPAGRGWADIGYHFAVDRAGRVWQGRSLLYQGAHVRNHNQNNVGIVVLGNFDLQSPTPDQVHGLTDLVTYLRCIYMMGQMEIWTHRELADEPTSCPGETLMAQVRVFRGF
jgi:hypothetical protein